MFGTARSAPLQFDRLDPPDTVYALAVGLYAAGVVAPAVTGAVARAGSLGPGGLYLTFLLVVTAVISVVTRTVGRWQGFSERVGRSALSWSFAVAAVPAIGAYLWIAVSDGPIPGGVALVGFFAATAAAVLGCVLGAMSRSRYTEALLADEPVVCEWEAGWPSGQRTTAVVLSAALMLLGLAVSFAEVFPVPAVVEYLGMGGYVLGAATLSLGKPWTYRVTPAGLERRLPVYRTVHRWEDLSGFEERDDVLVISRQSPWRLDFRCAWADIEDREAVVDALSTHVPRE